MAFERWAAAAIGCGLFVCASPSRADISIGPNFGSAFFFPTRRDDGGSREGIVYLAWPASSHPALQPGMRVGFASGRSPHEAYIDSGFLRASGSASLMIFMASGHYQYALHPRDDNTLYFTLGGGFMYLADRVNSTSATLGGGIGMRQRASHGFGTIREELRIDFISRSQAFRDGVMLSLKFGFDLWFR